jgi:hypothetical protein
MMIPMLGRNAVLVASIITAGVDFDFSLAASSFLMLYRYSHYDIDSPELLHFEHSGLCKGWLEGNRQCHSKDSFLTAFTRRGGEGKGGQTDASFAESVQRD